MRWPLRFQILLPFTVLLLGTVVMISALDAYFSARGHRDRVQGQLRDIAATLTPGTFPLTDSVLRQAHGLSGAHFAVATRLGRVTAASKPEFNSMPAGNVFFSHKDLTLDEAVEIDGTRYLHAAVQLRPQPSRPMESRLHILYPETAWHHAWWQNVYPPVATGTVALVLAAITSALIAAGVSRPVTKLRHQVQQIATGDFQALAEPKRNDEIRDLVQSVNRMSSTLADYEWQLRRDERLKALGQLRGGLAHQLRNAVTGCRMALDLHRLKRSPSEREDESIAVAHRQLSLIEKHLDQFLRFDADQSPPALRRVNLQTVVRRTLPLVKPFADHAHVRIEYHPQEEDVWINGDAEALQQVLINVVNNAIDAVASSSGESAGELEEGVIKIATETAGEQARVVISDNGPGPDQAVSDLLFEPLVTDKPHGTGLGLTMACETVHRHHGDLRWHRDRGWTHFIVELPAVPSDTRQPAPA